MSEIRKKRYKYNVNICILKEFIISLVYHANLLKKTQQRWIPMVDELTLHSHNELITKCRAFFYNSKDIIIAVFIFLVISV